MISRCNSNSKATYVHCVHVEISMWFYSVYGCFSLDKNWFRWPGFHHFSSYLKSWDVCYFSFANSCNRWNVDITVNQLVYLTYYLLDFYSNPTLRKFYASVHLNKDYLRGYWFINRVTLKIFNPMRSRDSVLGGWKCYQLQNYLFYYKECQTASISNDVFLISTANHRRISLMQIICFNTITRCQVMFSVARYEGLRLRRVRFYPLRETRFFKCYSANHIPVFYMKS